MNRLIEDNRQPVFFLNYKNKVNPDPLVPLGPNALGERLWPVTISDNKKRIGLSVIRPEGVEA